MLAEAGALAYGEPDLAHAAAPKRPNEAVRTDLLGCRFGVSRHYDDGVVEPPRAACAEETHDLAGQLWVVAEKRRTLLLGQRFRLSERRLDRRPSLRRQRANGFPGTSRHDSPLGPKSCSSSRLSQARADSQARRTVIAERPIVVAISS